MNMKPSCCNRTNKNFLFDDVLVVVLLLIQTRKLQKIKECYKSVSHCLRNLLKKTKKRDMLQGSWRKISIDLQESGPSLKARRFLGSQLLAKLALALVLNCCKKSTSGHEPPEHFAH